MQHYILYIFVYSICVNIVFTYLLPSVHKSYFIQYKNKIYDNMTLLCSSSVPRLALGPFVFLLPSPMHVGDYSREESILILHWKLRRVRVNQGLVSTDKISLTK